MKFHSWLVDKKINGVNVSVELTLREYVQLAEHILRSNDLQRSRVRSSGKTYELLRRDLLDGCVMPPIILAVTDRYGGRAKDAVGRAALTGRIAPTDEKFLQDFVKSAIGANELIILDGLQRTYTLQQALDDANAQDKLEAFLSRTLRAEIYLGLNKTGILYRMLTLNTGQTPMSFRHQIEILYHDYIDGVDLPDGIRVFREVDGTRARGGSDYKYQDVVDMFYAFSTGSPKSIDRQALVAQLKEMDFLEEYRPEQDDILFTLLRVYNRFVGRVASLSEGWHVADPQGSGSEANEEIFRPFGATVPSLFGKVQPMTGFGAECKRLLQQKKVRSLADVAAIVDGCDFSDGDSDAALGRLVLILDQVASRAKRIGDAQRAFFQLGFRELLNDEADGYQNLSACWLAAQEKYEMLYGSA